MAYEVEYSLAAPRQLRKLDPPTARRVGDFRVLCDLRDSETVILALEVGHRTDVYDGWESSCGTFLRLMPSAHTAL